MTKPCNERLFMHCKYRLVLKVVLVKLSMKHDYCSNAPNPPKKSKKKARFVQQSTLDIIQSTGTPKMVDCSEMDSSDAKFSLGRVSWLSKNYHGWTVAKRTLSRVDCISILSFTHQYRLLDGTLWHTCASTCIHALVGQRVK